MAQYFARVTRGAELWDHIERKRADATLLAFDRAAYETVKANAGLDTLAGVTLMHAVRRLTNADVRRGVRLEYRDHILTVGPVRL